MNKLQDSWSAFSPETAENYLKSFGYPSKDSKKLLADLLKQKGRPLNRVELGCGTGQLAEYFFEQGLDCSYTGVDFSEPLLDVARKTFAGNSSANFIAGDVQDLRFSDRQFDIAIFSHVLEILNSPQRALREARRIAKNIYIRFFEPPEFDETTVELLEMNVGGGPMPYLRWKMGRDDYRLILSKIGATRVDIHRGRDKDQVHIVHFD